ncbi:MAG TPA: hypothetical protein VIM46_06035 [Luteolibacter sp.]
MNRQTHSLARRVRDDFRLLSADTRMLLHQALQRDLPEARDKLVDTAHQQLGRGRDWVAGRAQRIRADARTPYVVGAIGLAVAAGLAFVLWRRGKDAVDDMGWPE